MRKRIKSVVNELHSKVALWLCENYRVILWPLYNVGRDRIFHCVNAYCANRRADRDHHGARNIGLHFLTEWASMMTSLAQWLPLSTLPTLSSSSSFSSSQVVFDLTQEEED